MKFILEINKKIDANVSKKCLERIIKTAIRLSNVKSLATLDVSLAFVSRKEIKKINKIYRKRDEATDILSFSDYTEKNKKLDEDSRIFCELVVCYPYIEKKHIDDKTLVKKEVAYILSHGILHCLGWKHSGKMYEIQERVRDQF